MISYVKGQLVDTSYDSIVVEASGLGYNIMITGLDYSLLPNVGSEIKVYTYFSVREDAMQLFGFLDRASLAMFKLLITVNGIGPKGAMAILSILSPDDLKFAIASQDSKAISKAPGVGAKTAQRVILELKDKVDIEEAYESKLDQGNSGKAKNLDSSVKNDAVLALTALGYSSSESLKAVSSVTISEDATVEEVISLALKGLL